MSVFLAFPNRSAVVIIVIKGWSCSDGFVFFGSISATSFRPFLVRTLCRCCAAYTGTLPALR